jgi:hypothetical protein
MSEPLLGENRVTGTVDLMLLYVAAKKLDLNRNLPDGVAANLDPNGNHVLTTVLLDHQAHPARNLPRHHRVSVIVKLRDTMKPFCAFLDVTAEHWAKLYTREETRELMVEGEPLELRPRLLEEVPA